MTAMNMAMVGLGLAPVAAPPEVAPIDYPLPNATLSVDRCRRTGDEDILVCGRRDRDAYRLRDVPAPKGMVLTRRQPFDWDFGGGARGDVDVDQVGRPDGYVDRRMMITVRIPF